MPGNSGNVPKLHFTAFMPGADFLQTMRRMQGALGVVAAGGPWVADIVHGTVGAALGTTLAIAGGGLLTVAAMLAVAVAFPALWRYRARD